MRLHAPEEAEARAPASWAFPTHANHCYWEPHVDQTNVSYYHASAVLYLTTSGEDFEGGAFSFHDPDGDTTLAPTCGDLLTFSSGPENPHSAGKVFSGTRFALACWFTRDESKGVQLPSAAASAAEFEEKEKAVHPLPMWSLDNSIASAASCCLASNDSLREAIEASEARGKPLARALAEQAEADGKDLVKCGPGMWLERILQPQQQKLYMAMAVALKVERETRDPYDGAAIADDVLMHSFGWKQASIEGDVEWLTEELNDGQPINQRNVAGLTALHFASRAGNEAAVEFLLSKGADPTMRTKEGEAFPNMTPRQMMMAQPGFNKCRSRQVVELLVRAEVRAAEEAAAQAQAVVDVADASPHERRRNLLKAAVNARETTLANAREMLAARSRGGDDDGFDVFG